MAEQENQVPSTLVNVKRVRQETGKGKSGDQEATVLTFGIYEDFRTKETKNSLDELIDALLPYKGKQVNFDIRVSEKTGAGGKTFPTAFVIVKEMIPRGDTPSVGVKTTYTAKTSSRQTDIKNQAAKFSRGIE